MLCSMGVASRENSATVIKEQGGESGDLVVELRPVSHLDFLALLGHTKKYRKKVLPAE